MRLGGVIAALAVAVASDACFEYACTLVACSDGLTVTLQSTDGSWKPGIYTFDLTINHTTARCTITVNLAPPEVNPGGQGQCPSGITLTMSQESTCVSHTKTNPDGTTEFGSECAPIPGHFTQTLEISGTPSHVSLQISRDGQVLTNLELSPQYQTYQPNGPRCDPTCHGARATVMVPAA
jgi:hypothetical protein